MTCACGMCVQCTFTVATCQLCPAMSEGGSKHSDFCDKRVQYCKNTLLRFQRSKNEISKSIFIFQSAKTSFQVPLNTRVHNLAYNNMTKPKRPLAVMRQLSLGSGMWHAGRGPTPGMQKIFPGPKKIFSKFF